MLLYYSSTTIISKEGASRPSNVRHVGHRNEVSVTSKVAEATLSATSEGDFAWRILRAPQWSDYCRKSNTPSDNLIHL